MAGILFSLLLGLAIVLLIVSATPKPGVPGPWLTDPARRSTVTLALNLVPFAGIAFLWFIGVVRDRIGDREDRFFASVFLGSGLLFVAMLFVGAASAGGVLIETGPGAPAPVGADTLEVARQITSLLLRLYAMRMAAVFTMSTAMITLRTRVVARWISVAGVAVALVLLVTVGLTQYVELLFPGWILLLSVEILRTGWIEAAATRGAGGAGLRPPSRRPRRSGPAR